MISASTAAEHHPQLCLGLSVRCAAQEFLVTLEDLPPQSFLRRSVFINECCNRLADRRGLWNLRWHFLNYDWSFQ